MYDVHKYVDWPSLMVGTPEKNSEMDDGATVVVVVVVVPAAGITVTVTVAVVV